MDITALAGATPGSTPGSSTTPTALSGLDNDAFLQLMIAQMRYQDPMSPSDPSAMMEQTSVLAQTEMMQKMAETQQQLLGLQQVTIAQDLIGSTVAAELTDGTVVEGVVEGVRFNQATPTLIVDGTDVPLSAATELRGPANQN